MSEKSTQIEAEELPRLTRRSLIAAGTVALGGVGIAQTTSLSAVAAPAAESRFMAISRLLVAHRLEPAVGRRIAAALGADSPPMSTDIDGLLTLARSRNAAIVEDFFPLATEAQRQSALKIISAWYLGVVDDRAGGQVLAYELALMFKTVSDVMTLPTYAISGPNGWGPNAPPLDEMPIF